MGRRQRVYMEPFAEPLLARLDGVVDYLTFLVEKRIVSGETAGQILRAAGILREAIREEVRRAGEDLS